MGRGALERLAHRLEGRCVALTDVSVDRVVCCRPLGGDDHLKLHEFPGRRGRRPGDKAADEVKTVRNRLPQLPAGLVIPPGKNRLQQLFLAAEMMQQPSLAQARPLGDITQGGAVKPGRGEHHEACRHDSLTAGQGLGALAAPVGGHAANLAEKT